MIGCRVIWVFSLISSSWAVGPSPVTTTQAPISEPELPLLVPPVINDRRSKDHESHVDRLWEEIGGVKAMMTNIAGQLDKFNSLYLGKLEHRMLTTATLLSSLDSNIHGLQERSHVWDTFQLHVAAWNEQIKSLDNKVDLLSRGQEKMVVLDTKVTQLMGLEYKLDKVAANLEAASHRIQQLESPRDPLMGEFATRGVLSTLKMMERKVDRLQAGVTSINSMLKPKKRKNETEEATGKLVIRCNTPPAVEEALQDVLAKVDLMYDRIASETESNELGDQPDTSDLPSAEAKILNKLWKRLTAPQRKMTKSLDAIESLIRGLNITDRCQDDDEDEDLGHDIQELLSCCRASSHRVTNFAENSETLLKHVEGVVNQVHHHVISGKDVLDDHFKNQRWHIESLLNNVHQICPPKEAARPSLSLTPLVPDYDGSGDTTDDEGSGDDEDAPNGNTHEQDPVIVDTTNRNEHEDEDVIRSTISPTTTSVSTPPLLDPWSPGLFPSTTTTSPSSSSVPEESLTTTPSPLEVMTLERSCEALVHSGRPSGVYKLGTLRDLNPAGRDFHTRNCDLSTSGGGWTVIQQRGGEFGGLENFTRLWRDYSFGFGNLHEEFWMGNEYIHRLTYEADVILRIELEDWNGVTAWAEYSTFRVDTERDNYRVWVSGYEGNATDAFGAHDGTSFSTVDRDNDGAPPCCPCAPAYGGGWWFYSCFEANLNGDYYPENATHEPFRGVIWEHWRGDYSLKSTRMMLRAKSLEDIPLDPPDQVYPDP